MPTKNESTSTKNSLDVNICSRYKNGRFQVPESNSSTTGLRRETMQQSKLLGGHQTDNRVRILGVPVVDNTVPLTKRGFPQYDIKTGLQPIRGVQYFIRVLLLKNKLFYFNCGKNK